MGCDLALCLSLVHEVEKVKKCKHLLTLTSYFNMFMQFALSEVFVGIVNLS